MGRFISADPIMDLTDPQQWNAYGYSNNNPTTFSDPSGLMTKVDGGGGGLGPASEVAPPVCNGGNTSPNCGGVADKSAGGYSSKTVTLPNGTVLTTSATGASINGYYLQTNSPNAESLAADVDQILAGRNLDNELDRTLETVWALGAACNTRSEYNCLDGGLVGPPGPSFYTTINRDLATLREAKGFVNEGNAVESALMAATGAAGVAIATRWTSGGFKHGTMFMAEYQMSNGVTVMVQARIEIKGELIYFRGLAFMSSHDINSVGVGGMLAIRNDILGRAYNQGFRFFGRDYARTSKSSAKGLTVNKISPIPPPQAPGGSRK